MDGLKTFAKWLLSDGVRCSLLNNGCDVDLKKLSFYGWLLCSSKYRLDHWEGICEDGCVKSIRYVNMERGERVFKMKAGKFMQAIIDENEATRVMPEQLKRWLGEEFSREWQSYASQNSNVGMTLHVDDDFRAIYSRDRCKGDFGSCMAGRTLWTFYRDSIDAKAAYLTDKNGMIVARCIVYQEVYDDEGNTYRLAERQYTSGQSEALKQLLVDLLIAGGHIDGYKRIGADCHDNKNFVANDGTSMRDLDLHIHCSLDYGDDVSYQDSFVYYDMDDRTAYNTSPYNGDCIMLDTTDGTIEDPNRVWSEYHEEYLDEDEAIYDEYFEDWMAPYYCADAIYNGSHINIDRERASDSEDFEWSEMENAFIYYDECTFVEMHNDYALTENTVDDIAGDPQLCSDCSYSHYHGEWILDEDARWSDEANGYLWVEEAVYSNHERDWLPQDDAIRSEITGDFYSSEESLLEGEVEFRREHALVVVA